MYNLDELAVRNEFIKEIEDIFAENYDTIKEEVIVLSSNKQDATFPCCVVNIDNPINNNKYDTSSGTNNIVTFTLNCELFTKDLQDYNQDDAVVKLSMILINGFLSKYSTFRVTRNQTIPNINTDVSRRIVSFYCNYDIKENIIYS